MSVLTSIMGGERGAQLELKKLAKVTGASGHFPTNVDQCRDVMKEIARGVSQQYSTGYYSLNKLGMGSGIEMKVNEGRSRKYVARARSGYYACRAEQPKKCRIRYE